MEGGFDFDEIVEIAREKFWKNYIIPTEKGGILVERVAEDELRPFQNENYEAFFDSVDWRDLYKTDGWELAQIKEHIKDCFKSHHEFFM